MVERLLKWLRRQWNLFKYGSAPKIGPVDMFDSKLPTFVDETERLMDWNYGPEPMIEQNDIFEIEISSDYDSAANDIKESIGWTGRCDYFHKHRTVNDKKVRTCTEKHSDPD